MLISRLKQTFSQARKRLTFEQLLAVQTMAEQVVLATEQTFAMPGVQKKAIALKVARELLSEQGLHPSDQVLDTAIEASVRLMKILESGGREELVS